MAWRNNGKITEGKKENGMQQKNESWQPLGAGYWAKVSREHRFSTDTLLLSYFSSPRPGEKRAAELCAGCGALSLLWMRGRERPLEIDAVEIQEPAYLLMCHS